MDSFAMSEVVAEHRHCRKQYLEFLQGDSMSVGVYELLAGGVDTQPPHIEDEVYYVTNGRGEVLVGEESQAVAPGAVIFVAAGVEHRFHSITEDLTLLVVFAPPQLSRSSV